MKKKVFALSIIYVVIFVLLTFKFAPLEKQYILIREGENIVLQNELIYSGIGDISAAYESKDVITISWEVETESVINKKSEKMSSNFVNVSLNNVLYIVQIMVLTIIFLLCIFISYNHKLEDHK